MKVVMLVTSNPYSELLGIMRKEGVQGAPSFYLGKVTKLYEISFNGITLYQDDLLINPDLKLEVGDQVVLIEMGDKFIVICKVVEIWVYYHHRAILK